MTLNALKQSFPLGCAVQLTEAAKAQGCTRTFRGTTGKIEGYNQRVDLGGKPFFTLLIWLDRYRRRKDCQPSLWERVGSDLPR